MRVAVFLVMLVVCAVDARAVTIAWSPVGDPGNAADSTTIGGVPINLGAVGYAYQIGTYDVTNAQYVEFLNAKDPTGADPLFLYSSGMTNTYVGGISFNASSTDSAHFSVIPGRGDMPVVYVNLISTLRFANWLNNGGLPTSDTETGSYTLLHAGSPTPTQIPSNFGAITRHANANVVLPNENEWYKAAYFNPATSSYFRYPTSSNTAPTASAPTGAINSANYNNVVANLTVVGAYTASASPYGTFDQGGDVGQWTEPGVRDGLSADGFSYNLPALPAGEAGKGFWQAVGADPLYGDEDIGFRVAMVPEPSSIALAALGLIGLAAWGWRRRRSRIAALVVLTVLVAFAADARAITIPTVPVGNAGNANDPSTGNLYGGVNYAYNIGTTEVTNAQYAAFLNAKAKSDPLQLYNVFGYMGSDIYGGITRSGVSGSFTYTTKPNMDDKPVNYVDFFDAIRFANWLNNGQGNGDTETGAYTILGGGPFPTNASIIVRNTGATWFLTSESEWYKAAYYDPRTTAQGGPPADSHYWLYPTQSNTMPTQATANLLGDISNPGANIVNYNRGANWNGQHGNITTVGSAGPLSNSFYDTADQGGNVEEWTETYVTGGSRVLRGGSWDFSSIFLQASYRDPIADTGENSVMGFRVASIASIPEPSSVVLAALGVASLVAYGWRRKRA